MDLDNGLLDVSILSIENGIFEVKATAENTQMGEQDFLKIYSHLENVSFESWITRALSEEFNSNLLHPNIALVEKTIQNAGIDKDDIQKIILVGRSTRIPIVRKLLQDFFNGKELVDCMQINPYEAVSHGAAILAASLQGSKSKTIQDLLILDKNPSCTDRSTKKRKLLSARTDDQVRTRSNGECVMVKDNNLVDNSVTIDIPPGLIGQQIRVWQDIDEVSFKIQLRAYETHLIQFFFRTVCWSYAINLLTSNLNCLSVRKVNVSKSAPHLETDSSRTASV